MANGFSLSLTSEQPSLIMNSVGLITSQLILTLVMLLLRLATPSLSLPNPVELRGSPCPLLDRT